MHSNEPGSNSDRGQQRAGDRTAHEAFPGATPGEPRGKSFDEHNPRTYIIVIGEHSRVHIDIADASTTKSSLSSPPPASPGPWTRWRKIGAFLVGAASIVGAVITVVQIA
jgi:hypothetical protein